MHHDQGDRSASMTVVRRRREPVDEGRDGEAGMTIVEVVVALSILAFVMLALGSAMLSGLGIVQSNRQRIVATNLASQEVERLRTQAFAALPLGVTEVSETVDGQAYDVRRELEWLDQGTGTGACDPLSGGQDLLRVSVSVRWAAMGVVEPVASQTLLSPTAGAIDPAKGTVAVKVTRDDGSPASGQTVTLAGGPSVLPPQVTPASGCTFFVGVAPGPAGTTYSVTLARPGWVDGQSASLPSQTFGVVAGETVAIPFAFDEAAELELQLAAPSGYAVPSGLAATIGNERLVPPTRVVPRTGGLLVADDLFPYDDGYTAWAGRCLDADPEGVDPLTSQPYHPGATRTDGVAVTPAGSSDAVITLAGVDVAVTDAFGVPSAGVVVGARKPADDGCAGGELVALGTTDAAGRVSAGLPYGRWTLEAPGATSVDRLVSPSDTPALTTLVVP